MRETKPEKAAIVAEVRDRLADSDAVLLTEYRGLKVADMAELRGSLRAAGGECKIYKNRLVRLAAADLGVDMDDLLTGPTAMAFVNSGGDAAAVAKALRDFSRANKSLVIKGGVLDNAVISVDDVVALAELPPREVLLAQMAGALASPLVAMASMLQALPRNFACALSALIDKSDSGPAG